MGDTSIDRNGKLLFAAKAVRNFAFGLGSISLGLHLASLDLPAGSIGFILAAALVGQLAFAIAVLVFADRLGRKRILAIGSALMAAAALIPEAGDSPALLVIVASSGMIVVSSREPLGMQSLEQATIPGILVRGNQTAVFSWYQLTSLLAGSAGALVVGAVAALSDAIGLGPYRLAFYVYALCGIAAALLLSGLDPVLHGAQDPTTRSRGRFVPSSPVAQFIALNALDAFGTGLILQSFIAYWFATRHGVESGTVGLIFTVGGLLAAASLPLAARLAGRIGLVRTMVLTHLPASLSLIALGFISDPGAAIALYLVRSALSLADGPARQSYAMAVVAPEDRVSVASVIGLARSGAQSLGPTISGLILLPIAISAPLIVGGAVLVTYDCSLFALFRSRPAPIDPVVARSPTVPPG